MKGELDVANSPGFGFVFSLACVLGLALVREETARCCAVKQKQSLACVPLDMRIEYRTNVY
jgi:hypothetical protein